ncbi:MAG TPA: bifunctional oligoribonuclease/PAP phosphatase NrnA [Phycisphaerales bacterium]
MSSGSTSLPAKASSGWTATPVSEVATQLASIAAWLADKGKIAVVTHVKPDGDAVGSSIALTRALNLAQKSIGTATPPRARAWYFGPRPSWMKRVVGETPATNIESFEEIEHEPCDAVVIVDTGSWSQLEMIRPWLERHRGKIAIVDHHAQGDAEISERRVVDVASAAACQPVAELCRVILGKRTLRELPMEVAEPLYLGLATDTGWFKHSNVKPNVMEAAAALLATGVDHAGLYVNIEQRERLPRLKLLARALASLELHDQNRVAVMSLTKKDFAETGAQPADAGGFADHSQTLESVLVTAVLTEADPSEFGMQAAAGAVLTKISMRSKSVKGSADVNAAAKELGGGGHVRAAGAKLYADLTTTKAKVLDAIRRHWDK